MKQPKPRPTPDPRWRKLRQTIKDRASVWSDSDSNLGQERYSAFLTILEDMKKLTREAKKRGGA